MSRLRGLDDRLLPRAARRLRGLRGLPVTGAPRRVLPRGAVGPLDRLDARLAARGPFALLARTPAIGLAVVAVVLLAGIGRVVAGGAPAVPADPAASGVLGPTAGTPVALYVDAVRRRAVGYSRQDAAAQHVALVSFTEYLPVSQLTGVLQGVQLDRVLLAAPGTPSGRPPHVLETEVSRPAADLAALCAATSARRTADARHQRAAALSLTGAARQGALDAADDDDREARAYRDPCATVFGALVTGRADQLAQLPAIPLVRAVDEAPVGTPVAQLDVRPLLPEQVVGALAPTGG